MDFASAYQSQNNSRQFGSIQVIFKYHSDTKFIKEAKIN